MRPASAKAVRCAIYTRVSTDQGLEQDFNSLDAQYEASQAYIKSQAHAGWRSAPPHGQPGGHSFGPLGETGSPAGPHCFANGDADVEAFES